MNCCVMLTRHNILSAFCIKTGVLKLNRTAMSKVFANRDSSFQRSLKSKYFIDKSLLLKEIFIGHPTKMIIAPRGFGKSTNFAMIKHFLEIEVDENGIPIQKESTYNYKLFKDNNLNILRDKQYFKNHFGKYPVVFIDYSPLLLIQNFDDFFEKYKKVISNTFSQHKYLLKNKTLWRDQNEIYMFEDLIEKKAAQEQIQVSFKWLCDLLHRHFNKKSFILIDDYDAIIKSFIFKNNNDLIKISKLYGETEQNLLQCNESRGSLLTGELRLHRGDSLSCSVNLANSKLSQFYGITELEIDYLLQKGGKVREEIIWIKNITNYVFGGYIYFSNNTKLKLYRTKSVIHYFKTNSQNMSKICRPEYLEGMKKLCHVRGLTEWLHILLSRKNVLHSHVELSEPIFHRKHISILNSVMNHGKTEKSTVSPILFLTLLYYLGYLTPVDKKLHWFTIPNQSVQNELQSLLPEGAINLFSCNLYKEKFKLEQQNKSGILSYNFTVNQWPLKNQTAFSNKNFLDMLKTKCFGQKKNISSTDEIKRKIARWFMDEHLPF